MNHYQALGVETGATQEEIRRAFQVRAKEAHPYRKGGDPEEMQSINEAYY